MLDYFYSLYQESFQYRVQNTPMTDKEEIYRQAVYCFLTPATAAKAAGEKYNILFQDNFFEYAEQQELADCLRESPYIRFHNQKAKRLKLWQELGRYHVDQILQLSMPEEKRQYLMVHVKGMNFKESTHYLRNIGMSGRLAILDRHVLRFMLEENILSEEDDIKKIAKNYCNWEQKFQKFADAKGWSIPAADFAVCATGMKKANPSLTDEYFLTFR